MQRLIDGYHRFRDGYYAEHRDRFEALATRGQSPRAMVIACCDSRAEPQLIFDARPGEMFVVRNVANLVPPYAPSADYHGTSAALEFAVRGLKVEHVIVMGHAGCGGIEALLSGSAEDGDFIAPWMGIAHPARERALAVCGHDTAAARPFCEREAIKVSLANLMTFPWIAERVKDGALEVHGWYFDLANGALLRLEDDGAFRQV